MHAVFYNYRPVRILKGHETMHFHLFEKPTQISLHFPEKSVHFMKKLSFFKIAHMLM